MTLRIRRGLEADRTTITPVEGELIYTTDTKRLYTGDNVTAGGNGILGVDNTSVTDIGDTPRFERKLTGGTTALFTASRISKRVTDNASLAFDHGGPAINFQQAYGTASAQSIGLFGAYYQGSGTTYNHSYQFQLLSGGSGSTYDTVLNVSRLKANFDVPIKARTFSDTTERTTHYATFTEPDADPAEGDICYLLSDSSSKPRLQVYNNGQWYSLLTRRFEHTDPTVGPIFVRESTSATAATAMRVIKRKTDDTTTGVDRTGPAIRYEHAYGTYDPNATAVTAGSFVVGQGYRITSLGSTTQAQWNTTAGTSGLPYVVGATFIAQDTGTGSGQARLDTEIQFLYLGSSYYGTTGNHSFSVYSTPDNGNSFVTHFSSSPVKFTFNIPAKLVVYADTTARSAGVPTPEAGMMIYLTSTNKAQVYNGTTWQDLN